MLHLRVKNFGVLKDIDIELGKTNLFIGDNGSGKSTLAKLVTVITDFTLDEDGIIKRLKDFDINFLSKDCFVEIKEQNKLILKIEGFHISQSEAFVGEKISKERIFHEKNFFIEVYTDTLNNASKHIDSYKSKYIPAERNLISLFNKSLSNFVRGKMPLPETLLEFSAEYSLARNEIKELDILDMRYKNENDQDRIYYKDNDFLSLENSSSGIQSALPLYLTLKYFANKHKNIIVEEPELNLYPKSQIDTVKYMIENCGESSLSIMTHSPYILSILNVLIFAHKASSNNDILKEKISAIIPQTQHINPDEFSACLIEDGVSKSIKGKSTGMIESNVIDDIGGELDDDFNELMDIYSEFKSDK